MSYFTTLSQIDGIGAVLSGRQETRLRVDAGRCSEMAYRFPTSRSLPTLKSGM